MATQGTLPGFDSAEETAARQPCTLDALSTARRPALGYSLFLALRPEDEAASRIHRHSLALHQALGINPHGAQTPDRLHLTLLHFNKQLARLAMPVPTRGYLEGVRTALNGLRLKSLCVEFDALQQWSARQLLVLSCTPESNAKLLHLRQQLQIRLRQRARHGEASATPHMTLNYRAERTATDPSPLENPITWQARSISLILSHVGATHHQLIQAWPLNE